MRRWWCTEGLNPGEAKELWARSRRFSLPAAALGNPPGPRLAGPAREENNKWWCIQVSFKHSIHGEKERECVCFWKGGTDISADFWHRGWQLAASLPSPACMGPRRKKKYGIIQIITLHLISCVVVLFVGVQTGLFFPCFPRWVVDPKWSLLQQCSLSPKSRPRRVSRSVSFDFQILLAVFQKRVSLAVDLTPGEKNTLLVAFPHPVGETTPRAGWTA